MPGPELLRPTSLKDALEMLRAHGEDALPLAGGTALVLMMRQRLIAARYLVDLTALPGLREIAWAPRAGAQIGALATLGDVERSPALRGALPLLAETCATVGNVRVRNAATVGGNLAHGDYRLDPPAALLALDARVTVAGRAGDREVPLTAFWHGFEETALERGELITTVTVPPPPRGAAGAYVKFSALAADDWPCVGAAALVALDGDGRVTTLRVAVTAVNPVPILLEEAGALAIDRAIGPELVDEVARLAATRVEPIPDIRGSEWYKREVTAATVRDALERALERAAALRAAARAS
ncbi:MAG: FAD binding domain-containing protein [Candidatus Rokuibacteriota bacterium]